MIALFANVLALVAVLVLAYFVIKGGAKLNRIKHRTGQIKLIESTAVGGRERVVLVSYNNQRYLLGVTNQNVSIIDQHEELVATDIETAQVGVRI